MIDRNGLIIARVCIATILAVIAGAIIVANRVPPERVVPSPVAVPPISAPEVHAELRGVEWSLLPLWLVAIAGLLPRARREHAAGRRGVSRSALTRLADDLEKDTGGVWDTETLTTLIRMGWTPPERAANHSE